MKKKSQLKIIYIHKKFNLDFSQQMFLSHNLLISDLRDVIVRDVLPDSPAARAGIQPMRVDRLGNPRELDVITHIDGEKVESLNGFRTLINAHGPGDKVLLGLIKRWEGGSKDVEVTLGNREDFLSAKERPPQP